MADKETILREPTKAEDFDKAIGQPIAEVLKALLTVGGGVVGAPSGPVGAVGGAALGNMAGQSLENTYKELLFGKNAIPSPMYKLPEAAIGGASAEMGGQLLGKGISEALKKSLVEKVPQKSLKDYLATDNSNILRSEYHGSSEPILNPVAGKAQTTKGEDVFFTSPTRDIANQFATLRAFQKMDPETFNHGVMPQGVVTPYMMSKVNTLDLVPPVSFQSANKVGELLGINKDDVTQAILESMNKHGNIDGEHLWEKFAFLRNSSGELGDPVEVGGKMVEKLKDAGYRRMLVNMDPGNIPRETVHFYPEEDLYSVGGQKLKDLLLKIEENNKKTVPVLSDELAQILGKAASNTAKKLPKSKEE